MGEISPKTFNKIQRISPGWSPTVVETSLQTSVNPSSQNWCCSNTIRPILLQASQSWRRGDGWGCTVLLRVLDDPGANPVTWSFGPRPLLGLQVSPQGRPNVAFLVERRSQGGVLDPSCSHDRRIYLLHGTMWVLRIHNPYLRHGY